MEFREGQGTVGPAAIELGERTLPALSVHDGHVLASFIHERGMLLDYLSKEARVEMKRIPDEVILGFRKADRTPDVSFSELQNMDIQRARAYALVGEYINSGEVETILGMFGEDDPRSGLISFIRATVETVDDDSAIQKTIFEKALRAQVTPRIVHEHSRKTFNPLSEGVVFTFDDGSDPIIFERMTAILEDGVEVEVSDADEGDEADVIVLEIPKVPLTIDIEPDAGVLAEPGSPEDFPGLDECFEDVIGTLRHHGLSPDGGRADLAAIRTMFEGWGKKTIQNAVRKELIQPTSAQGLSYRDIMIIAVERFVGTQAWQDHQEVLLAKTNRRFHQERRS